jgi:hypothetical protein
MYAHDLVSTIKVTADLLDDDGVLVFSVPPFRFAILRKEIEDWGHGFAYNKLRECSRSPTFSEPVLQ